VVGVSGSSIAFPANIASISVEIRICVASVAACI